MSRKNSYKNLCFTPPQYLIDDPEGRPQFWNDVIPQIGKWIKPNIHIIPSIPYFKSQSLVFLWHPELLKVLTNVLSGNDLVYLCWGFPKKSNSRLLDGLKSLRLRLTLRLAKVVLVNDETTQKELLSTYRQTSNLIPYYVDLDFFSFKEKKSTNGVILVGGDIDRDEEMVLKIAKLGYTVIRVTRSAQVLNFYQTNTTPNIEVHHRVGYKKLLLLYHQADIVLLPIKKHVRHAAGQTVVLEAMATGTPVVTNNQRVYSIFETYSSVLLASGQIESFEQTIKKALKLASQRELLKKEYAEFKSNYSVPRIAKLIDRHL